MSRGATSAPGPHPVRDVLQSSGSKILKLEVSYPSFEAPQYAEPVQSITGRLWLYDAAREVVVLETGAQAPLPAALRSTVASAVYDGAPARSASGTVTGFKMVRVPHIVQADIVPDEARPAGVPAQLTVVPGVPKATIEAREAAAARKCSERTAQLGPPEAGTHGQWVFDSLCKTYVWPAYPAFRADGTSRISSSWTKS